MDKNQYLKYILDYLLLKQKQILSEMGREKDKSRIEYYRGTLGNTVDMIGCISTEYKKDYQEEIKKEANHKVTIDGTEFKVTDRTKDLLQYFIAELEKKGTETEITREYKNYLTDLYTL